MKNISKKTLLLSLIIFSQTKLHSMLGVPKNLTRLMRTNLSHKNQARFSSDKNNSPELDLYLSRLKKLCKEPNKIQVQRESYRLSCDIKELCSKSDFQLHFSKILELQNSMDREKLKLIAKIIYSNEFFTTGEIEGVKSKKDYEERAAYYNKIALQKIAYILENDDITTNRELECLQYAKDNYFKESEHEKQF